MSRKEIIMQWWLISDATKLEIQDVLECTIMEIDARCANIGCRCGRRGRDMCSRLVRGALDSLERGSHLYAEIKSKKGET